MLSLLQRMSLVMINFWLPQFKWQYVNWLSTYYPQDKASFKRMNKNRLTTIYINVRQSLMEAYVLPEKVSYKGGRSYLLV